MKKISKRRLKTFFFASFFALALTSTASISFIYYKLSSLPEIDATYLKQVEPTKIVDKNGVVLWQNPSQRITTMTYNEIPELYKDTLIAVEDGSYWTNSGISYKGIITAIIGTIRSKVDKTYTPRGGSTIEQQLIKNTYYNGGRGHDTATRKIQELFLAKQLDDNFGKETILEYYVNKLEFAEGSIGLKAIMKTYFDKEPKDYKNRTTENIAEQAYLVGLGQAPSTYNLYTNPEQANERKNTVLSVMKENTLINDSEYQDAIKYDLTTNLKERYRESKEQVERNRKYKAYTDGVLTEINTIGYDIDKIALTINTYFDVNIHDKIEKEVLDKKYHLDDNSQIAVTVINKNFEVVSMIGGRGDGELNRAMQQTRSSGSSMKPFTAYGPLFEYFGNQYHSGSIISAANYVYPGTNVVMYNYGRYQYGNVTMHEALKRSLNTPVGRIDDQILGSMRMKTFLNKVGLDVKATYSSVDGIGINISTLQAAAAYNTLNNAGLYTKPKFISKIIFPDGSEKEVKRELKQAMNPSTAYVLTQMLRAIPQPGFTADAAQISKFKGYGGKTGSVAFGDGINPPAPYGLGGSDVWYDSITNNGYSISIWVGYDIPNTSPQVPDTYKGHQKLGASLQQLLVDKADDWQRPNTVRVVGGSGLDTYYQVTDSKDIDVNINVVQDIPTIPHITKLKPEIQGKQIEVSDEDKDIYNKWKANTHMLDDTKMIDKQIYESAGVKNEKDNTT